MQHYEDLVNHPNHYEGNCSIECIEMMQAIFSDNNLIAYCLMSTFKYLWRYKYKNGNQDIDKAEWQLNKAAELIGDRSYVNYYIVENMFDLVKRKERNKND